MSILTCHVAIGWADDAMRETAGSFQLRVQDPRVLLAAHRILLDQPAVVGADLVSALTKPFFVVALSHNQRNEIELIQDWFNGVYNAFTVVFNANAESTLQVLPLRIKFEVVG